jgi:type IV pilus assembly protein PilB
MANMSNDVIIGELLVRAGLTDSSALAQAREVQKKGGTSLAKALETLRLADGEAVSAAIAESLHLELLQGDMPEILPEVVALLPGDFCHKRLIAPLSVQGNSLRLALADPMDYSIIQGVEFRAGKRVVAVVAPESCIQSLRDKFYPPDLTAEALKAPTLHGEVEELEESEFEVVDPAKLAKDTKTPPVIRLVNLILSGAAQGGASDIHMEPKETHLQVRYRVDGLLHDVMRVGKDQQEAAISRMKIISGMDIADRRRPQDGRSRLRYEGKRIDLRVSTLPTQFGEKVVIRLLARPNPRESTQLRIDVVEITGNDPGDGAHRLREELNPVHGTELGKVSDQEHHHRRGPHRVSAGRRKPGPNQSQSRCHVCGRTAIHSQARSKHYSGRRDPRP